MSDTIEQHQGRAALKRQGDRIWRWRTDADGVRQTGAWGQAANSAVEIGIDMPGSRSCGPLSRPCSGPSNS
jgi:hypothetical protein